MKLFYLLLGAGALLPTRPVQAQRNPCVTYTTLRVTNITATSAEVNVPNALPNQAMVGTTSMTYAYGGTTYPLAYTGTSAQLTGLPPVTAVTISWTGSCRDILGNGFTNRTVTATFTTTGLLAVRSAARGGLGLHPNPATARFTLTLPSPLAASGMVQLTDALGRTVRQQSAAAGTNSVTVEVAGLAAGVYTVRCGSAVGGLVIE